MNEQVQPRLSEADSIVDIVHQPMLVLGADLRVQRANAAYYHTFKVKPEETVDQLIFDLGNQQWRIPALQKLLEDVLFKNKDIHEFEVDHDFRVIGRRTMLLSARRLSREGNPHESIVLAIEDISERRRSRHFNFSHDLLCVANLGGFFLDVNPSFQHVLGYSKNELLENSFFDFMHPEDKDKTKTAMIQLKAGSDLGAFQNRYQCKNGLYRLLDWTCPAPLPGEQLLYAAARDITDLTLVEEELRHLNSRLTQSNSDLEQFAYVASHDLQEPLRAVAGCVQIIQKRYRGKLDGNCDELIGHTVEGVNRMQTLINDLLQFSRVARRAGEFVPIDLTIALSQALKNLETSVSETAAVITQDPLPMVVADRGQMTRLFQNLLSNALKFRGSSPPIIHIGARRAEHAWRISVRDNGIGIDRQYFDRIFVLFQRLHTRTEYPGTGIGLAICKRIVEQRYGEITVESQPGTGSTFCFTIPDKETER